jgi:hypothetical protein
MVSGTEQAKAIKELKDYMRFLGKFQKSFGFQTPANLILEHGEPYLMGPKSFKGPRATPHMCYKNSYELALDRRGELTYVEGYCLAGIPIEHAWCVDSDGLVVEPTIIDSAREKGKIHVQGYFGVPFMLDYVMEVLDKSQHWGVFNPYHNRLLTEGLPQRSLEIAA